jgi:predicted neutral ceramidase superfamily lipid hydrolase
VFGIAILGLVVLAVRSSTASTTVGLVLGLPATVLLLIQAVTGDDTLLPYSSALEAILYFYAGGALIGYMLADHVITRDELFAVGATFTLVAWAFAYSYTVARRSSRGASPPRSIRRRNARGWNCSFSASPPSPAPG